MRLILVLLLCSGCVMQLRADIVINGVKASASEEKALKELMGANFKLKPAKVETKTVQKQAVETVQVVKQEQVSVTKKTYGSMKKPLKTITIDVYAETDVEVEQRQKQIAKLIAQLKQLQESKVKVDPKVKVVVR